MSPLTLEHRNNIRKSMKRAFKEGKLFTKKHRENLSLAQIGKSKTLEHRTKIAKTLTGKSYLTEEGRKRLIQKSKGRRHTKEARDKIRVSKLGEKNYRWEKDRSIVLENKNARRTPEYRNWKKEVSVRDNNKCRLSNKSCKGKLIAHHIKPWAQYKELRFIVSNGIILCERHHPKGRVEELKQEEKFINIIKEIKI